MHKVETYLAEVTEELNSTSDQRKKLEILVDLGRDLPEMDETDLKPKYKVPGCISETYVKVEKVPNGEISILGQSDSLMVRGYLSILCNAFTKTTKKQFLSNSKVLIDDFLKSTEIHLNLTPSRSNSFGSIYNHMLMQVNQL